MSKKLLIFDIHTYQDYIRNSLVERDWKLKWKIAFLIEISLLFSVISPQPRFTYSKGFILIHLCYDFLEGLF